MQTIPAEVQTLLKSRQMIAANRPTHKITIAGAPTGSPDFSGTPDWTLQGQSSTLIAVSNWLQKTDGSWMCCWFDATSKELQTGFSADLDFLETDYAIESVVATPAITVDIVYDNQCALHKRSDGSVLLIATNHALSAWTKCFISETGDGDDWVYYSTVGEGTAGTLYTTGQPVVGIPIVTSTGRIVLTYVSGDDFIGGIWTQPKVSFSDDDGLTWTVSFIGSYGAGRAISQPCQLPDGSIFLVDINSTTNNGLYQSINDGSNWTYILNAGSAWGNSVSLMCIGSTAYALCLNMGFYQLENATAATFVDPANWTKLFDLDVTTERCGRLYLCDNHFALHDVENSAIYDTEIPTLHLNVKSISVDRSRGSAAAQATIILDNTGGVYSPDGAGDWAGVIMPNALATIEQGYGADLAQTFVGYVDSVEMTNFPAELRISCRDKGKLALDRIVTNAVDGGHYCKYTNKTIEYIVGDLVSLCNGLTTGTIEATGMTLASKLFSWESYADAMDWLADLSSSTWRVDELGALQFTRDVMPVSPTTAYSFAEGEDIISLGYTISDTDLYYQATVYGQDANGAVVKATADFGAPLTYGLFSQKVLKIDAPDADTVAKCQEIADRAVALMLCRCRVVDFAAIAVPWLQVGDFIQVTETTTTISELYRVTNISTSQGPDGFTMGITAFWYGEVPS